jgi:hypothetical protein
MVSVLITSSSLSRRRDQRVGPKAIKFSERLQDVQVRVERAGAGRADVRRLAWMGDWAPIIVEKLDVTAVGRVVAFGFQGAEEILGGGEGSGVAAGAVVGAEPVEGEGVQVNVLAAVGGPAGVGHLGEVAAVGAVAELPFKELEPGFGRGEGGLPLDAGRRQRAEEPELPGLERQELLAGRRELAVLERLQVAAVDAVEAGGQVEVDDAGLEEVPAAAGLLAQLRGRRLRGSRWRFVGRPANRWEDQEQRQRGGGCKGPAKDHDLGI